MNERQTTPMVLGHANDRYVLAVSDRRQQAEAAAEIARLRAVTGVRLDRTEDFRYAVSADSESAIELLDLSPKWSWPIPKWGDGVVAWCADEHMARNSADDDTVVEAVEGGRVHRLSVPDNC